MDEDECHICLDLTYLDSPEERIHPLIVLSCHERHAFHETCLREWFKKSRSCPICRSVVEMEEVQETEERWAVKYCFLWIMTTIALWFISGLGIYACGGREDMA